MKYCENCGNQLTDNAVYCPKCGTRVGGNSETPKPVKNNNQKQKEGLNTAQKITLGVVALIGFAGLFSGEWIPAIICICALIAVAATFMGAIDTKYAWTATTCCAIAVMIAAAATPDEEEGQQSQSQTEQKQKSSKEKAQAKKESNPYAKFVGKYVLYDDEGGKGQRFIVAPDGRFLQDNSFDESDYKNSGGIIPKNDSQFEVSLSSKIFGIHDVWSYKNNQTCAKAWDISYNNTLLFDLNEKRMYIDIKEYNNRDYTKPEYYKFRFTKQ